MGGFGERCRQSEPGKVLLLRFAKGGLMPAERLSMRKVREVLRLKYACGASERVIARSVGIGRTVVGEYIRRAAVIGITWPIPAELDDTALERRLFAPAGYNPPRSKPQPDWSRVHTELRRRGVTLALLW